MIKFESISKIYKEDLHALEDINLEIQPGEFVSIVGHSGAGKSTLLKMIYLAEKPTAGEIYFDEIAISEMKKKDIPEHRRNIGTIFQDFKLLKRKTIFENVAFALEVCGEPEEEIQEDVPKILEIVGLGDKMDAYPEEISAGQQQKLSIARALIHKPLVIIADEPTGNLDPESSIEILNLLLKINKLGTTVILATHDKMIVDKAGKRVICLEDGRVKCDVPKGKYNIK